MPRWARGTLAPMPGDRRPHRSGSTRSRHARGHASSSSSSRWSSTSSGTSWSAGSITSAPTSRKSSGPALGVYRGSGSLGASIHPADRRAVLVSWEKAWRNGSAYRAEYRMVRPDGEEVWVRDSCVLVLSHAGTRLAWQGVIEDLTTEKRSREGVRASEAEYRALVERLPAVVYEMGPDDERRTLYVSPHVEEVLGYTRAEWLDQPDIWIELLHADDREVVLAAARPAQRDGRALGPRVPLDRERRPGRLGPRPRHA